MSDCNYEQDQCCLPRLMPGFALCLSPLQHQVTQERAVEDLDKSLGATTHLVETLCKHVALLHEKVEAATTAAAQAAAGSPKSVDMPAVKAAAVAEMQEGSWSYFDILKEILSTIKFLATNATGYFDEALAEQLWDTLMVNAPCGEDQLHMAIVSCWQH